MNSRLEGSAPPTPVYRRISRQYIAMTEQEVWTYVDTRDVVIAAFVNKDGFPHATPVWFCTADGRVYFRGASYKVKFQLADQGKACLVWESGRRYVDLKGVVMWGTTSLVRSARIDNAISEKYSQHLWKQSEVREDWVAEKREESRTLVQFTPNRISSWDNNKVLRQP